VIESLVAIAAARAANGVALRGFGVDSMVESASGSVLLWRLLRERRTTDRASVEGVEQRARQLVAMSLFVLAADIAVDAMDERHRVLPLDRGQPRLAWSGTSVPSRASSASRCPPCR
jgi:hypothetical protein